MGAALGGLMGTRTWVELDVSPAAYNEIREKLVAAGYEHAIGANGEVDMHGIAIVRIPEGAESSEGTHS